MATFDYADKVALNVNANIPRENKVTDDDMNLIKNVGNQILSTMGVYTDNWSSSATYSPGDIVISDNRIFQNLTGNNTATEPENDTTNWLEKTIMSTAGGGATGDTLPIGSIMPYGSSTVPGNWLVCDGSAVSRTTFADLFAVIGTSFGAGDGSTTFNLPNLKGKVPVGQNTSDTAFDTMGETGGSKEHKHRLPLFQENANGSGAPRYLNWNGANYGISQTAVAIQNQSYGDLNPSGNAGTMNGYPMLSDNESSLQPYQVVCYIIKAYQSAGVVANVFNTNSNSQADTYSCNFTNGTVLYQNNSGTNQTINLSDNLTGYKRFDVYCSKGPATSNICRFWQTSGKFTIYANAWANDNFLQAVYQEYEITNATTLTPAYGGYINYSAGTITQGAEYELKVYKIIGYKY